MATIRSGELLGGAPQAVSPTALSFRLVKELLDLLKILLRMLWVDQLQERLYGPVRQRIRSYQRHKVARWVRACA